MESSEQNAYVGTQDPHSDLFPGIHEIVVVLNKEDADEETIPINESMADTLLQKPETVIDGQRYVISSEIIGRRLVINAHKKDSASEQTIPESSDDPTLALRSGIIPGEDTSETAFKAECVDSDNNHSSGNELMDSVNADDEGTSVMFFIPTESKIMPVITKDNKVVLRLVDVAREQQLAGIETERAHQLGRSVVINAESVASPQMYIDNTVSGNNSSSTYSHDQNFDSELRCAAGEGSIKHELNSDRNQMYPTVASLLLNYNELTELMSAEMFNRESIPNVDNPDENIHLTSNCVDLISDSNNLLCVDKGSLNEECVRILIDSNAGECAFSETHVRPDKMDETNDTIDFSCGSSYNKNVTEDELKEGTHSNSNDVKRTSKEVDNFANLGAEAVDISAMHSEREMAVSASTDTCSEIQAQLEKPCLPLNDNLNSKSSIPCLPLNDNLSSKSFVYSSNCRPSQSSVVHNFSKINDLKSLKKSNEPIDVYEFDNSSSNLDGEISHNYSPKDQTSDVSCNSGDMNTEVYIDKISQSVHSDNRITSTNLTYLDALTPTADKKINGRNVINAAEPFYNNSKYLCENISEEESNFSELAKGEGVESHKNYQNSKMDQSNAINETFETESAIEKISDDFYTYETVYDNLISMIPSGQATGKLHYFRNPEQNSYKKYDTEVIDLISSSDSSSCMDRDETQDPEQDSSMEYKTNNTEGIELNSLASSSSFMDSDSLFSDEISKRLKPNDHKKVIGQQKDKLKTSGVKNKNCAKQNVKKKSSAASLINRESFLSTKENTRGYFCPNEKDATVSNIIISEGTTVLPPKRSHIRKKKKNSLEENKTSNKDIVECISIDDSTTFIDSGKFFKESHHSSAASEHNDELKTSSFKKKKCATFKKMKKSSAPSLGDEKKSFHSTIEKASIDFHPKEKKDTLSNIIISEEKSINSENTYIQKQLQNFTLENKTSCTADNIFSLDGSSSSMGSDPHFSDKSLNEVEQSNPYNVAIENNEDIMTSDVRNAFCAPMASNKKIVKHFSTNDSSSSIDNDSLFTDKSPEKIKQNHHPSEESECNYELMAPDVKIRICETFKRKIFLSTEEKVTGAFHPNEIKDTVSNTIIPEQSTVLPPTRTYLREKRQNSPVEHQKSSEDIVKCISIDDSSTFIDCDKLLNESHNHSAASKHKDKLTVPNVKNRICARSFSLPNEKTSVDFCPNEKDDTVSSTMFSKEFTILPPTRTYFQKKKQNSPVENRTSNEDIIECMSIDDSSISIDSDRLPKKIKQSHHYNAASENNCKPVAFIVKKRKCAADKKKNKSYPASLDNKWKRSFHLTVGKTSGDFCPSEKNNALPSIYISEETTADKTDIQEQKQTFPVENKTNNTGNIEFFPVPDSSTSMYSDPVSSDKFTRKINSYDHCSVASEHNEKLMTYSVKNMKYASHQVKNYSSAASDDKEIRLNIENTSGDFFPNEKKDMVSDLTISEETTVEPSKRTYIGKRKQNSLAEDKSSNEESIEKISINDFSLSMDSGPLFCDKFSNEVKLNDHPSAASVKSKVGFSDINNKSSNSKHSVNFHLMEKSFKPLDTDVTTNSHSSEFQIENERLPQSSNKEQSHPFFYQNNSSARQEADPTFKKFKCSGIKILADSNLNENLPEDESSMPHGKPKELQFACSTRFCNFETNEVNNIIMHLKYCLFKPSRDTTDYRADAIMPSNECREDLENSSSSRKFANGSAINMLDSTEGECSSPFREEFSQYTVNDQTNMPTGEVVDYKTKYGFCKREIVWAKVNSRFWPALIMKIDEAEVLEFFIEHPSYKGLKLKTNCALCDLIHTYADAKWNKKLMEEAVHLSNFEDFVRAVQRCDLYLKKKYLYYSEIDEYQFFRIPKQLIYTEIVLDENSIIEENLGDFIDKQYNEYADVQELLDCILEGQCDEHVLSIYHEETFSKRHEMYFDDEALIKLQDMSWFGSFKTEPAMQLKLYYHFSKLYTLKIGKSDNMVSYIYDVWIPEAIIKAISFVKRVDVIEAEIIFYKQDICLTVEDFETVDDS